MSSENVENAGNAQNAENVENAENFEIAENEENEENEENAENLEMGLEAEENLEKLILGGSLSTMDLEDLFNKNTESFRCLAQIFISRSSLLRHPLYHFPPLADPELDEVFYYVEPIPEIDTVAIDHYIRLCKKLEIVPLRRVIEALPTEILDLTFYGLREKQVNAIMDTLKHNEFVTDLILQDNFLTPTGVKYITDTLFRNHKIRILNLCECRIEPQGALNLSDGLAKTTTIYDLDLSFCSLGSEGIELLEDGLSSNTTIVKLNLSHNNLGEAAAQFIANIFNFNGTIKEVDLSWNDFYTKAGNKVLFASLSLVPWLRSLNLAWNGIRKLESVTPISKYLKTAKNLVYFDISNNRLAETPLKRIRVGASKCPLLQTFKIGNNIIKPEEVPVLLKLFDKIESLQYLDLENIYILKSTVPLWKKYLKREKTIVIGGVLSNYEIVGPDITKLLFDRALFLAKKTKKKDFGHFILKLPEENISLDEFLVLIKAFKIKKVDKDLINAIAAKFPGPKGKLNLLNMKSTYMEYYPHTELPPKKPKKGKGKKGKGKGKGKKGAAEEPQPPVEGQPGEPPLAEGEAAPLAEGEQPPLVEGEQPPALGHEQPPSAGDTQPPSTEDEQPLPVGDAQTQLSGPITTSEEQQTD